MPTIDQLNLWGRAREKHSIRPGTRANRTYHWPAFTSFLRSHGVNWRLIKEKHLITF